MKLNLTSLVTALAVLGAGMTFSVPSASARAAVIVVAPDHHRTKHVKANRRHHQSVRERRHDRHVVKRPVNRHHRKAAVVIIR